MKARSFIFLFIILFLVWLILSAGSGFVLGGLGAIIAFVVIVIGFRSFIIAQLSLLNDIKFNKLLLFIPYIVKEILLANIYVLGLIIKNKKVKPQLVSIKNPCSSEFGEYMLAVSITLTPGTLIVEYNKEELLVMALDDNSKASLLNGDLLEHVVNCEKKSLLTTKKSKTNSSHEQENWVSNVIQHISPKTLNQKARLSNVVSIKPQRFIKNHNKPLNKKSKF